MVTKTGSFNYHSFTLLASSFINTNSKTVNDHKLEPPYEKKGNGTPMVGNNFISIVMFTKKWVKRIVATQYP